MKVTDRRTNQDFAHCMRELVDLHYPDAPLIRVVMDDLSTHSAGAIYDTLCPASVPESANGRQLQATPRRRS